MQRNLQEFQSDLAKAAVEASGRRGTAGHENSDVDDFMEKCRHAYGLAYARAYVKAFQRVRTELLSKQLRLRFGELPTWVNERLQEASDEQFDRWLERVLIAGTLDSVFAT